MRVGQPVLALVEGVTLHDVVAIPRIAIRQLDQIIFIDKDNLTIHNKTVKPIWSNEEHVVVRDPTIEEGAIVATTRLVYAPEGAAIEIIPDLDATKPTATTKAASKEL